MPRWSVAAPSGRVLALLVCVLVELLALSAHATRFTEGDYRFLEDPVAGELDVRLRLDIGPGWSRADTGRIVFCYDSDDNGLFVEATSAGLVLGKVRGSVGETLANWSGWPKARREGGYDLTVKRRAWSISVLVDGAVVLRAYDAFSPGERVGCADRSVRITDLHAQPIGDMMLEDGFARPPDEPNPWEAVSGSWETSLPEARDRKAQASRSSNPFSFKASAESGSEAMAVNGSRFWDSYQARVAVKPAAPGQVGLAFYVQGDDCYLLRVTSAEGDDGAAMGRAELVRRLAGAESVLAGAPCVVSPGHWHDLAVRAFEERLEGLVNGELVCAADDGSLGEGKIALYTRDCPKAFFDDVRLSGYARYEDAFGGVRGLPVQTASGRWSVKGGCLAGRPAVPSPRALALTGCNQWANYAVSADVSPGSTRAVGLCFGATDADHYYAFRWGRSRVPPREFIQELCRVDGGQWTVLAQRAAPLSRLSTYRVEAVADRSYLSVSVDGERVLDAVDLSRPPAGQVGYLVEGAARTRATFDNVEVRFLPPPKQPVSVTEQFAKENTMADWARPAASWQPVAGDLREYALPVWGDFVLRARLAETSQISRLWSIGVAVAADTEALGSAGPALVLSGGVAGADAAIAAGDERTAIALEEGGTALEIERRGGCLLVRLEGQPVAWTRVPDGDAAPSVGLKLTGNCAGPGDFTLTSPNIVDEVFASAPVAWLPAEGTWDISDRWHCSPQWSWLCGRKAETPLLWFRRPVAGDMVLEYWGAMMMDLTAAPHYEHPSDLNAIICGDGRNLCSGYAFVFAGDNNTVGRILRRGGTVAETPKFTFHNPVGANTKFHNAWFHSRVERTGGRLRFSVDDRAPLEFEDPEPLEDGHVGIWTHQGNGILIARARIAFRN